MHKKRKHLLRQKLQSFPVLTQDLKSKMTYSKFLFFAFDLSYAPLVSYLRWPMYMFWRLSNSSFPAGLVNWFNWFLLTLQTAKSSTKKKKVIVGFIEIFGMKKVLLLQFDDVHRVEGHTEADIYVFFQLCRILLKQSGSWLQSVHMNWEAHP